jgi:small subunit ribosomal protein S17
MAKTLNGTITAVGNKTATVEVVRQFPHPLYRKLLKRSSKFKVFTDALMHVGDVVEITETKPVSKDKYFRVSKVITEVKGVIKG